MTIYKNIKTEKAKKIVAMGTRWAGDYLWQCYDKPSAAKQRAFEQCYNLYANSLNASHFSICSYNSWGFTCSWLFTYIDPETGVATDAIRVETPKNSYIVLLVD